MGIMDDTTNTSDEMQARIDELRREEEQGTLDDAGRAELQNLRQRMMDND